MEKHPVAAPLNEGENGEVLEHLFVPLSRYRLLRLIAKKRGGERKK